MSMSGWVCIAIILGMTFGQLSFEYIFKVKKWKKVPTNESLLSQ